MNPYEQKFFQIITISTFFLGGMWIIFFINNVLLDGSLSYGVHPRTVGIMELFGISFSWIFHGGKAHIVGNTMALITMIPMIAAFERRPWFILWMMVFMSGFITWCLGAPNTNHIGASGLIFAIIGYIFSASIFAKKYQYWIPIFLSGGSYWFSLKTGLIPQQDISFAGHFGGLIAGIILGFWIGCEDKINKKQLLEKMPKFKPPVKAVKWSDLAKNSRHRKMKSWYMFWKNK